MKPSQVILQIGAEGGTLTVLGEPDPTGGWKFMTRRNQTVLVEMLPAGGDGDTEPIAGSGWVDSLAEALALLDRYPWFRLLPLRVHPDFREEIWHAVALRHQAKKGHGPTTLARWRERCGIPDDGAAGPA